MGKRKSVRYCTQKPFVKVLRSSIFPALCLRIHMVEVSAQNVDFIVSVPVFIPCRASPRSAHGMGTANTKGRCVKERVTPHQPTALTLLHGSNTVQLCSFLNRTDHGPHTTDLSRSKDSTVGRTNQWKAFHWTQFCLYLF